MKLANILSEKASKINISNLTWKQFVDKYTDHGNIKAGFELTWNDDYESTYRIEGIEVDGNKVHFGADASWYDGKWNEGDWEAPTDVSNKQYAEDVNAKVDSLFQLYKV